MSTSHQTTLTTYAIAFLSALSLFGLVDTVSLSEGSTTGPTVASAITRAYLLPILGLASASFLVLSIMVLSRSYLPRPQIWNSERAERRVLDLGLAVICYFGVLALLSYVFALIAPAWANGLAVALTRHWPWLLALPCLVLGGMTRHNKPGWLTAGAVLVTMGIFTA